MYVNHIKINKEIKNVIDLFHLQNDLDNINKWAAQNVLSLNRNKCKSMFVSLSLFHVHEYFFSLNKL